MLDEIPFLDDDYAQRLVDQRYADLDLDPARRIVLRDEVLEQATIAIFRRASWVVSAVDAARIHRMVWQQEPVEKIWSSITEMLHTRITTSKAIATRVVIDA